MGSLRTGLTLVLAESFSILAACLIRHRLAAEMGEIGADTERAVLSAATRNWFDTSPTRHVLSISSRFLARPIQGYRFHDMFPRSGSSMNHSAIRLSALVFLLSVLAAAQDVASFEKRITTKKLANGLTVIVMERPEAPVFSFFTHVDAGSVQDPMGKTGLAHMFEHMAFKGTDKIGTKDYAAEKAALAKVEVAYSAYVAERDKAIGRDESKLKELEKSWKDAIAEADKYVKPNEFGEIVERQGGEGMNANTSEIGRAHV